MGLKKAVSDDEMVGLLKFSQGKISKKFEKQTANECTHRTIPWNF